MRFSAVIMYDPGRKPTVLTLKELQEENKSNAFWCGPTPWKACGCGSSTFRVVEFGHPYRCTDCNKEFTEME